MNSHDKIFFTINPNFENGIKLVKKKQEIFSDVSLYTKEFISHLEHLLLSLPNEVNLVNPMFAPDKTDINEEKNFKLTYYKLIELIDLTLNRIASKNQNLKVELKKAVNAEKTPFMHMVNALSYKNITMLGCKAPYSSSESWITATRRAISIVEQIYDKPDINYYKALLTNVVEILSSDISEADIEAFYTGDKKIIYSEFGYNIMELSGTLGSLPGVSYGLYLIVRSIEKSSSFERMFKISPDA